MLVLNHFPVLPLQEQILFALQTKNLLNTLQVNCYSNFTIKHVKMVVITSPKIQPKFKNTKPTWWLFLNFTYKY